MARVARTPPDGVAVRSEGQRRLIALGLSLAKLQRALGDTVTRGAIHGWRVGTRSPGPRMRATLASVYGIPPTAWSQLPGSSPPSSPSPNGRPRVAEPDQVAADQAAADQADQAPRSTLTHAHALLRQIQTDRSRADLLPSERVRLADSETRALALRARLEREQIWFEDRIVREHPAWLKIKREIVRVLVAYPDAAAAVAKALAELDA